MATKKSTRKPTFVDRAQKAYQTGRNKVIDAAVSGSGKRMQKAEARGRQFGEPDEMSEAKKERIRANRAAAKKRK